ncbi:MAG: hypothetical protein IPK99_15740 [Flavobacteriales bacterium]|nr:hypothetical protein [Flavobacteriales bacterium]
MVVQARIGLLFLALFTFLPTAYLQGQWTWIGGSSGPGGTAVYGPSGLFDPSFTPGALYAPGQCVDSLGRLWVFSGKLAQGSNDLWCFDPAVAQWAWISGGQGTNNAGSYGIKGLPAPTNLPKSRGYAPAMWCDAQGDIWIFGGGGASSELNDLWRFRPGDGLWTWMHGDSIAGAVGVYGTMGIADPANTPGRRYENTATWRANDGTLWLFGGETMPVFQAYNDVWRFDTATGMWTWMHGAAGTGGSTDYGTLNVSAPTNSPGRRGVWTRWTDDDGRFWLFGGMVHGANLPRNDLWMFDPDSAQWTWKGGTTLDADLGQYGTPCVPSSGNIPAALFEAAGVWRDDQGRFYFQGGGYRNGLNGQFLREDIWRYDPLLAEWTWLWGSGLVNPVAVHGTLGVASALNTPGGRMGALTVPSGDSLVYLYGGYDIAGQARSDLWVLRTDQLCVHTGSTAEERPMLNAWYDAVLGVLYCSGAEAVQHIAVHDALGRILLSRSVPPSTGTTHTIPLSQLPSGFWLVTASGSHGTFSTRIAPVAH